MSVLPCLDPVEHAARHNDAIADRATLAAACHRSLMDEFCTSQPEALIETPGWGTKRSPLVEVVADLFAGSDGDALLSELLRIVEMGAELSYADVRLMRMRCHAWRYRAARAHADFHTDDAVAAMEEA